MKNDLEAQIMVNQKVVSCDGAMTVGHPLIYLKIGETGSVVCPYCSRRFVFQDK